MPPFERISRIFEKYFQKHKFLSDSTHLPKSVGWFSLPHCQISNLAGWLCIYVLSFVHNYACIQNNVDKRNEEINTSAKQVIILKIKRKWSKNLNTKWILYGRKLVHCNSYLWVHVSVSLFVFLVKIHSCFVTSNKCHANHCEYFIWTNHRRLDVFQCQCKHVIVFRMPFFLFVILIIYILFT